MIPLAQQTGSFMGRPRTIPIELLDKAVADYETSKSCVKSAKKYGLVVATLYKELARRGIERVGLEIFRKERLRKLPDISEVKRLYDSGMTPTEIGKKYGAGNFAVIAALRKAGIERRPRGNSQIELTGEHRARLMELYDAGYNYAQIAGLMGLAPSTISRIFRREGIFAKKNARERHGSWKGGRIKNSQGYMSVLVDADDPMASMRNHIGYVLEHRLVMARSLGRVLERRETVHHINGDVGDNRLENLQLRHGPHGKGAKYVCNACGSHDISPTNL